MKRIFIPVLAAAAVLSSCSEWTEAENKDYLPPMRQDDPVAQAAIREFKADRKSVV